MSEYLATSQSERLILPVSGGHMFYDKCVVRTPHQNPLFIKGFNESLFTDQQAADSTRQLLIQEADAYEALQNTSYAFLPDDIAYDRHADILYLTAHLPEDGWHWDLPTNPTHQQHYIRDVLQALNSLETVPASAITSSGRQPSLDEVYQNGWHLLNDYRMRQKSIDRLELFRPQFHDHVQPGVDRLIEFLGSDLFDQAHEFVRVHVAKERPVVAHFDARQSNIAWHPDHGAKLVDWSWASPAPYGTDRTMFIIDIFKTGYDVTDLVPYNLEPGHALLQMGHWLSRGSRPSAPGDNNVRFHQMASAVSAAQLLL